MDSGPVHRAICVLVIALATLSGCTPMSPDYPVAQLEFDETLLGEWLPARDPAKPRADPDAKEFSRVVVEPRMVEHNGTRVNPALAINHLDKNKPRPTLKQYRVIVAGEDESGPHRLQFEAYLIKFGQTRLLGLQLEVAEEAGKTYAPLIPYLLPVHFVVRLDRDGDRLHFRAPKAPIVGWIPLVKPLDAAVDAGSRRAIDAKGLYVAESVDRLLEHYAAIAENDEAWQPVDQEQTLVKSRP